VPSLRDWDTIANANPALKRWANLCRAYGADGAYLKLASPALRLRRWAKLCRAYGAEGQ